MKIRLPARKAAPPLKRPPKLKLKASVARSRRTPIVEEEDEDFLEEPEPNMKLSHAFVVVLVLHVIAVAGVFAFNSIKARQADVFSATKDDKTAAATSPAVANAADPSAGDGGQASDPSNGVDGGSAQPNPPANQATTAATPAASATPAAAPATTGSAKTHEMQPGETLTKVASEYGVSITELEKANNITDPKKIRAGTVLNIPEGGTAPVAPQPAPATAAATTATTTEPAAASAAASTVKDSGQVYTVAKGDNPWKIAKKLKVPYTELMELNGNPDPKKLQIGQKLKVPASAKAPAAK
jgi:LysM repeat protein